MFLDQDFLVFLILNNENFDSHEIVEGYQQKDNRCLEAMNNYVDHLARGLSISS